MSDNKTSTPNLTDAWSAVETAITDYVTACNNLVATLQANRAAMQRASTTQADSEYAEKSKLFGTIFAVGGDQSSPDAVSTGSKTHDRDSDDYVRLILGL